VEALFADTKAVFGPQSLLTIEKMLPKTQI
jgi:hypothetical protein